MRIVYNRNIFVNRTQAGGYKMISSMTGFGRMESVKDKIKITVEMKAVNHRYLDLNIKIPKKLSIFEIEIRTALKKVIQRGKVDVFITFEDSSETASVLHYNETLAGEYIKYFRQMADKFHLEDDIRVSTLARFPEIFTMEEQDADETALKEVLNEAIQGAVAKFLDSRMREGENLKKDMLDKLDELLVNVDFIEKHSPQIITNYQEKLKTKVKELLDDKQMDESRIAAEVTIFADKICVDEEIVRLRSHILAVKNALTEGGSIGRKLDFIVQEMNREANTILSKSTDLAISNIGIELKTSIEKLREQIQNIE